MKEVRVLRGITLIFVLFFSTKIIASEASDAGEKTRPHLSDRIQTTFIENKGEIADNQIAFLANLSNGIVYVKKSGIVSYDFLPEEKNNLLVSETFTPQKIVLEASAPPPADVVNLYKQKGYLQDDSTHFYRLSLGEIYEGVKLELAAYIDGLDKFLTLSSQANIKNIQIKLEGIKEFKVDKGGMLQMMASSGEMIKFTKPYAYQVMENERKPVEVSYRIHKDTTYGFEVGKYNKTKPLMILFKTYKGEDQ